MEFKHSISYVFPMFNEIDNIEQMVLSTMAVTDTITSDYEIVVVDDASTDGSGELLDELAKKYPQIKPIHHPYNRKLGGALKTGFYAAKKELIIYIDSDLPIDLNDIKLALPMIEDADFVTGHRLMRTESFRRKFQSKIYNWIIRLLFGLKVKDVNFAFKLFKRSILEKISLQSEGSFIDAELLIETKRFGYKIKEIGLMYYPRSAGESTLSGFGVIMKILKEMNEYRLRRKNFDFLKNRFGK
ncbi:MAG TPA: glycosyltransferase family 2 protein [Candidatus Wallbacteria bacterium]|nr:glycosyltransferase family 2 protein [Candidatus Wallbacteria bacterium]